MNSLKAMIRLGLAVPAIVIMASACVSAETDCLNAADEKIRPNEKVRIRTIDGRIVQGRFFQSNPSFSILTLYLAEADNFTTFTVSRDEIAQIKYYRRGRIKPSWMIIGFFGGVAVGTLIQEGIESGGGFKFNPTDDYWYGGFIGGPAGLLLGLFLPFCHHTSSTISCDHGR